MALLSVVEEMERSSPQPPFSNGAQGESWMNLWCAECVHIAECPLILVAVLDRTPEAWVLREPGGLNRYTCAEYVDVNQSTQEIR